MWITRDVDVPDDLIAALRKGRLVMFAGAGVSIGPPSSLPDFGGLADQIAAGAAKRDPAEPLDHFLGRCERLGVDVQRRAREILDVPTSMPTDLHRELLRLFGETDRVRVVTTNFDRHFRQAATDLHGANTVGFYHAPALPLGARVKGIIHVHGALEETRHPLVLTDADFGRAYLTEGWATRFLLDLFLNNTVCFIGYGHNDPTMHYLARALVPGTARFALTPPGDEARWVALGVKPISYPLRTAGDRHAALGEAVQAWATDAVRGVLEHEHQIRELVSVPPAADPHLTDYLRDALADPTRRELFLRYARGPHWLQFASDTGLLDRLFGLTSGDDHEHVPVANWLAEQFMLEYPSELLVLLRARKMQVGHLLWQTLAWWLFRADPRPSPGLLARWVAVLVATRGAHWSTDSLSNLLEKCPADALDSALLLFAHLTEPRLVIKEPWGRDLAPDGVPRLHVDVVPVGDQHTLRDGWERVLRPALGTCHRAVATYLADSLTRAHHLLLNTGAATDQWDPLSFGRAGIESHPQDRYTSSMDVVIDAARDTLEFALREKGAEAQALITLWENSPSSILRRLAIHGRTENTQMVAKDELDRVLAAGWLGQLSPKHEVFRLLSRAYAAADEPTRGEFLKRALATMTPKRTEGAESQETDTYERYNLLVWLCRTAPDSEVTKAEFDAAQAAYPEFSEREHPDLSHWSSGVYSVQPRSPITAEGLLEKPPEAQLEWLLKYEGSRDTFEGPGREGLLLAVRDAAKASFQWGWDLAQAMTAIEGADRGLWAALLDAWANNSLSAADWSRVLSLLHETPLIERAADRPVAGVLEKALDDASKLSQAGLSIVIEIAARLVSRPELEDGVVPKPPVDWLLLGINHTAGKAMLAWLRALGRIREAAGDSWSGLPPLERDRLERVLSADGRSSERARTIIASQAHFLFGLDPDWWRSEVLPLFDWTVDETRASQAWSGYLQWGRWNNALLAAMRPSLEQTYKRIARDLPDLVEGLAGRLSGVALYGADDPWHGGWLERFVADADPDTKGAWVAHMGHELRGLKPDTVRFAWSRWIADYWADRLTGVPRPLTAEEREGMAEWVLWLEPVAAEAVALIEQMNVPVAEHTPIFFQLLETGLASREPVAMARLVRHLLKGATQLRWECEHLDRLVRLFITSGVDRGMLLGLCEAMARLGCGSAGMLRQLINPR